MDSRAKQRGEALVDGGLSQVAQAIDRGTLPSSKRIIRKSYYSTSTKTKLGTGRTKGLSGRRDLFHYTKLWGSSNDEARHDNKILPNKILSPTGKGLGASAQQNDTKMPSSVTGGKVAVDKEDLL